MYISELMHVYIGTNAFIPELIHVYTGTNAYILELMHVIPELIHVHIYRN